MHFEHELRFRNSMFNTVQYFFSYFTLVSESMKKLLLLVWVMVSLSLILVVFYSPRLFDIAQMKEMLSSIVNANNQTSFDPLKLDNQTSFDPLKLVTTNQTSFDPLKLVTNNQTSFDWLKLVTNNVSFYIYPGEWGCEEHRHLLMAFRSSPYYTDDPATASLFVPSIDLVHSGKRTKKKDKALHNALESLPHWNGGRNHLILLMGDHPRTSRKVFGHAIMLETALTPKTIRAELDMVIPLFFHSPSRRLPNTTLVGQNVQFNLTFRGKVYTDEPGVFRQKLRGLDNGGDVRIELHCHPDTGTEECEADRKHYNEGVQFIDYRTSLLVSRFTLCPGGRQQSTYRLREALCAGSVPVILDDRALLPFSEIIDWDKIVMWWPESEPGHKILQTLREMPEEERLKMQAAGQAVFHKYLETAAGMVEGIAAVFSHRLSLYRNNMGMPQPSAATGAPASLTIDHEKK